MIGAAVRRRAAAEENIEQALGALDDHGAVYFGCDAGVAGLHPLQATLIDEPDLALRLFADGLSVRACTALGRRLLSHPGLADVLRSHARGAGRPAIDGLRAFLAAFVPLPELMLTGALCFDAWRLAANDSPQAGDNSLGQLYFATRYWQREGTGAWHRVDIDLQGLPDDPCETLQPPQDPNPARNPPSAEDDHPPGGYAAMVGRALVHLRDPALVSLTLSQSFRRRWSSGSPSAAFVRLRKANPAPATFFFNDGRGECLFGASPDLQLRLTAGQLEAFPVCGTVARGAGPVGEAESFRELVNEAVDAASLAVCTDALRNDLAPLCVPGSLRLLDRRRPLSLATVVHTVDRLGGALRAGCDAWDAITATAAPVMVTGTPRATALAAIAELEASPRGWYGGLMVQVRAQGDALAGTILRAAVLRDGVAEVRTGGDLMADSVPAREEQESRLKAISLWRALGLEDAATPRPDNPPDRYLPAPFLPAAVALLDGGDPFANAMRDVLQGMGLVVDARAGTAVLAGTDVERCQRLLAARTPGPCIAVGDAAAPLLRQAGLNVRPALPAHGRLLRCTPTTAAPWPDRDGFLAAQYANLFLRQTDIPAPWEVWLRDAESHPVLLVHPPSRLACLLFRPDSLMSGAQALRCFRDVLAWISQPPISVDYLRRAP